LNVSAGPRYAGLVTRFVAFVADAAIVNAVAFAVVGAVSLALSIFGKSISDLPDALTVIFGIGGWVVLNLVYFVGSWTLTGQTVGMRVMKIRVQRRRGAGRLSVWRGAIRLAGMVLAAIPLFLGYLPILIDDRRRGFQDWLAGTVVVFDDDQQVLTP
jgi:uncharacterized RDD family membrane protein YckC